MCRLWFVSDCAQFICINMGFLFGFVALYEDDNQAIVSDSNEHHQYIAKIIIMRGLWFLKQFARICFSSHY